MCVNINIDGLKFQFGSMVRGTSKEFRRHQHHQSRIEESHQVNSTKTNLKIHTFWKGTSSSVFKHQAPVSEVGSWRKNTRHPRLHQQVLERSAEGIPMSFLGGKHVTCSTSVTFKHPKNPVTFKTQRLQICAHREFDFRSCDYLPQLTCNAECPFSRCTGVLWDQTQKSWSTWRPQTHRGQGGCPKSAG